MDEQRSHETRARAELALVRLMHALGNDDIFLVVLGGLVPEVLASDEALVPEHLGTTDVDVLLITHVDSDADLGSVERGTGTPRLQTGLERGRLALAGSDRRRAGEARVPLRPSRLPGG
jgi:hypothetical protein